MPKRRLRDFSILFKDAADKGLLLLIGAALAFAIANSKYGPFYDILLNGEFKVHFEEEIYRITIHHFINDFLMVIFFLNVGLEIKKEMIQGHLSQPKQRILPIACAMSGVAVPALIYYYFNYDNDISIRGWAIPTATDIAFTLGVFAYFGKGLPLSLKVFLTALAIIDDLIAILIIALFYSDGFNEAYLYLIIICGFLLYTLNKLQITNLLLYSLIGCILWYLFWEASIHTTVAGVMLAMFIPLNPESSKHSPLERFSKMLQPSVAFFILPLFAFANSGVIIDQPSKEIFLNIVTLGIILGLFLGKQIGIFLTGFILSKLKIAKLPEGSNLVQFYAISLMCGIGFTMSLFIGELAFGGNNDYTSSMKIGVLCGSLISAIASAIVVKKFCKTPKKSK